VGSIPVYGRLILSPMDGFSDLPFRSLVRRLGSAMSYTEFINVRDVVNGYPYLPERVRYIEEERPVVFQIFDDRPDRMLKGAIRLQELRPDIIDVNLGCPAKTVSIRGAGAGLLREPKKIETIIHDLVANLSVPVTAKIRLGWDDETRNYLEVAKIIEGEGGKLIAVHGRTRVQAYRGEADWDAIAEVKQAVKIPVIGNGDVRTTADIERIIRHTGCDGVMIGRAAVTNPWIFCGLDRGQVDPDLVHRTMVEHLRSIHQFYGEYGLILFRKFAKRYLKPYPVPRETIYDLMTREGAESILELLDEIFRDTSSWASAEKK
jgi:nifR3 family TIM-barrel protein